MSDLELGKKRAEELGLKLITLHSYGGGASSAPYAQHTTQDRYLADDIHRLLGEGVEAVGNKYCDDWWAKPMAQELLPKLKDVGLIIGIRPIVQESEERKLLRKLSEYTEWQHTKGKPSIWDLVSSAKRLLDGEK